MLKSRAPSPEASAPVVDASPLASLARTLQALEERLALLPLRGVPMADPDLASGRADSVAVLRKAALTDAVSDIVMQRQMLDREIAAGHAQSVVAESLSPDRGESAREEQLKTLVASAETLKAQGNGYSAMSEVAAELQRLREEIRRDTQPKADPRFEEMRWSFDQLRIMIESRQSQDQVGPELARIADGLAQLTEDGADRSMLNTLRAEFEAVRGLFTTMARDTSLKAEAEIEVKRDIKDELRRLRESLRTLASEDQMKAVEKRWSDFEERYEASPTAPDETAISRLLQSELESVREQIEALSEKDPMTAVEKRWDALEERLDTRQMEATIQHLSERMGDLEQQLSQLPGSQAISAIETRVRMLAETIETLARQSSEPDLEPFLVIEERLDEISRAIVASSLQHPAIDMAPIERIEARIATLTARIGVSPSGGEAEMLAGRVAELSAKLDTLSTDGGAAQIAERMAMLAERFEAAFAGSQTSRLDTSAIEARLAALTSRLEETAVPHVDARVVKSLEAQIARLAESLDRPERLQAGETDPEVERRLAVIEQRLDDQRDALIAAAREIADDTAKRMQAIGDRRQGEHIAQLSENLKALESLSRESDERAGQVFDSLHGTLMKIIGRLEQIELDVGSRRAEAPAPDVKVAASAPASAPASAKSVASEDATPSFLRAGGVAVAEKPAVRESVAAPSIDASDMLDRKEANRPLEPGSGAPDIGALLDRLQLQRGGKNASAREPLGDAELVAAARRASRAAAAAVESEAKAARASSGPSGGGRLASFVQRRRKPILVAIIAVIAALAALPLKAQFESASPVQSEEAETIEGANDPIPFAPAVESAAVAPSVADGAGAVPVDSPAIDATAPALPSAVASAAPAAAAAAPRDISTADPAAILARAEAKLPPASLGAIPAVPEGIGTPALSGAATEGDVKALFEIGLRLMEGRNGQPNPTDAMAWFAQAAKRGFAPAQYSLGTLFEKGNGVTRDTGAARDWYLLAADQGNVRAMHNLAVLYATGVDGVSDPDTALGWFEKAADYGMRDSQYNLGILYARGSGAEQDLVKSYKWFSIVAKSGDKDAEAKMEEIARSLPPEQLQRAEGLASVWTQKQRPEAANTVEVPAAWTSASDSSASLDMKRAVRNIQAILGKLGYDAGQPDGVIGTKTKMAILAFQKKSGLEATGSVDAPLIRALLERKNG